MKVTEKDLERLFGTSDLEVLARIAQQVEAGRNNPRGAGRKRRFSLQDVVNMKALQKAGVPYTVAPGATAFACALVLAGMDASKFTFLGFLPNKKGEKLRFLEKYKTLDTTLLFHSAPQDVDDDIAAMAEAFGDRPACAVREITKIHEESRPFTLAAGLDGEKRGEYVLVVAGAAERENPLNALPPAEHIRHYMAQGLDKKEALKRAARDRGVSKSALYPYTIEEE